MPTQTPPEDQKEEAMSVANAIISARAELGLTQAQLADASGVSRSTIKGYETGRNVPGGREIKAICKVLRLSPNALLFGTEVPFHDESGKPEGESWLRDALAMPESEERARVRLIGLLPLLTTQERASVLNIVQGLAVGRHGPEIAMMKIEQADADVSIMRGGLKVLQWAMRSHAPIEPSAVRKLFEDERKSAAQLGPT